MDNYNNKKKEIGVLVGLLYFLVNDINLLNRLTFPQGNYFL